MTVVGAATGCPSIVLWSEYAEGNGGSQKYLEVWNCSAGTINTSDITIQAYSNAGLSPAYDAAASTLAGAPATLAAGEVLTICHTNSGNATFYPLAACDVQISGNPVNFNGNDPLVLAYQSVIVDSLGIIGNSANYAINVTLERANCTGDSNPLSFTIPGVNEGPITNGTENFNSLTQNTNSSLGTAPSVVCPTP